MRRLAVVLAGIALALGAGCMDALAPSWYPAKCDAAEMTDSIQWAIFGPVRTHRWRDTACPAWALQAPSPSRMVR